MDERDKNLLNIGVLLSEDMERIEVMYEGFDMGCFILGMLDAEMRGLNSPEALEHLRSQIYGYEKYVEYERICGAGSAEVVHGHVMFLIIRMRTCRTWSILCFP